MKDFVTFVAFVVIVVGGTWLYNNHAKTAPDSPDQTTSPPADNPRFIGGGGGGRTTVKTVGQLTENEKEGLKSLTKRIYDDVGAQFFYETTYNFMPVENGFVGKKLDKPIVLLSAACAGPHMLTESTLATMRSEMHSKAVAWTGLDGKEYNLSILEGFLEQNPGGAGGTMYSSNDMVTIVPTKIEVNGD